MTITPTMIKAVREQTNAGLSTCKEALSACNGDIQAAVEHVLANGRDIVFYYTLQECPMDNALLMDDQAHRIVHHLKEALEAARRSGRLDVRPAHIDLSASLEGTFPDYGHDEIAADINTSRIRRYQDLSKYTLVQAPFVRALEDLGVTHFKAYPVVLRHPGSAREWPDFFMLAFTRVLRKELLRDNAEPLFLDKDQVTRLYVNGALKARLVQLGWEELDFTAHALPVCRAEPLDAGSRGDTRLLERLGELFQEKKPRYRPGAHYDAMYFIDRLLEHFSDVDFARIKKAIERSDHARFFYVEDAKGDWLGMREVP